MGTAVRDLAIAMNAWIDLLGPEYVLADEKTLDQYSRSTLRPAQSFGPDRQKT